MSKYIEVMINAIEKICQILLTQPINIAEIWLADIHPIPGRHKLDSTKYLKDPRKKPSCVYFLDLSFLDHLRLSPILNLKPKICNPETFFLRQPFLVKF